MKKIFSVFIAISLTLAMAFPVWSDGTLRDTLATRQVEGSPTFDQIRRDLLSARDGGIRAEEEDPVAKINERLKGLEDEITELSKRSGEPAVADTIASLREAQFQLIQERDRLTGTAGDGGNEVDFQAEMAKLRKDLAELGQIDGAFLKTDDQDRVREQTRIVKGQMAGLVNGEISRLGESLELLRQERTEQENLQTEIDNLILQISDRRDRQQDVTELERELEEKRALRNSRAEDEISSVLGQIGTLQAQLDSLGADFTVAGASDGGKRGVLSQRTEELERLLRDHRTALGINAGNTTATRGIRKDIGRVEDQLRWLPTELAFNHLDVQPRILAIDEKTAGASPETLLQLVSYLEILRAEGKTDLLKVVLLRFENNRLNTSAIPVEEWVEELNKGLSRYAGEIVQFKRSDFKMVVDEPELLGDAYQLNEEVSKVLRGGITDYVGRPSFADELTKVVKTLIAKVFNLPESNDQAIGAVLNPLLEQELKLGKYFVNPALPEEVKDQTRLQALDFLRKL